MTAGEALRDQGVADVLAAETAAHRVWLDEAQRVLERFARAGVTFTADDLREAVRGDLKARGVQYLEPHHPNVYGALFRSASRQGLIAPTGQFVPSTVPSNRARVLREWSRA